MAKTTLKGDSNIAYMIGLIVIFMTAWIYLIPSMTYSHTGPMEKMVNNMIYVMKDSLELSVFYVETSARYSTYQAMYDSGKNGTFQNLTNENSIAVGSERYAIWNDGNEGAPSSESVLSNLGKSFDVNFLAYTERGTVNEIFPVSLPFYSASKITPTAYGVRLEVPSSGSLRIANRISDAEEITLSKAGSIDLAVDVPFMQLYAESLEAKSTVYANIDGCDKEKIESESESFCCRFSVKVLDGTGDDCSVLVKGYTKKKFLIWDGRSVAMEPIGIQFVAKTQTKESGTA